MIYTNPQGFRVETLDVDTDPVQFWRAGGGFRHSMPRRHFLACYKLELVKPAFKPGFVTADWLEQIDPKTGESTYRELPCLMNGERWNGWAMPYFSRTVVDELIALGMELKWDGDDVIVPNEDCDEGGQRIKPELIDGWEVWPVGAGSWCWDAVEEEAA